jgi:hypothetical protein
MNHDMIELNDEQLDMVAGGDGNGNSSIIANSFRSDTSNTTLWASGVQNFGAAFSVRNSVGQNTSVDNSTQTWLDFN